jgi:hypothetical protein
MLKVCTRKGAPIALCDEKVARLEASISDNLHRKVRNTLIAKIW